MSRASTSAWSRRRAAVQAEAHAEVQEISAIASAEIQAEQAKKSDADILAELSLQDPDQMQAGDDFSAFLRDEVPARLQRRALRVLWRSNPVLACVDELVDYGDDFKAEGMVGGVIKTAYQVGKGMLAHIEEMERQQAAETEVKAGSSKEEQPETDIMDGTDQSVEQVSEQVAAQGADLPEWDDDDTTSAPARRRMRFEFDGTA